MRESVELNTKCSVLVDDTLTAGGNSTDPSGANPDASPAAAAMENSPTGEQQTSVVKSFHFTYSSQVSHTRNICNYKNT